jgi:hypothetical protein
MPLDVPLTLSQTLGEKRSPDSFQCAPICSARLSISVVAASTGAVRVSTRDSLALRTNTTLARSPPPR